MKKSLILFSFFFSVFTSFSLANAQYAVVSSYAVCSNGQTTSVGDGCGSQYTLGISAPVGQNISPVISTCNSGQYFENGVCKNITKVCPDGKIISGLQKCDDGALTYKSCLDGSMVSGNGTCPAVQKCTFGQNWNGYSCVEYDLTQSYEVNDPAFSLPNFKQCSDGSTIPETSPCPVNWVSVCDNTGWASAWGPSCHYVYIGNTTAPVQNPSVTKICGNNQFWNGYMCDSHKSFDDPVYPTTRASDSANNSYSNYTYSAYAY